MAGLFDKKKKVAVPVQPSFDTMQKVAIPDYRMQVSYTGNKVRPNDPNTVFFDENEIKRYGFDKNQVLAHELQHQIEQKVKQQNQFKTEVYSDVIADAWRKNSEELGVRGREYADLFKQKLANSAVRERFKELGIAHPWNRVAEPSRNPIDEILADLSGYETAKKIDLTKDPVLQKYLFNNDTLTQLYKSTTGMSGVVIGDSDYAPYSLEAAKAWNKPEPTMIDALQSSLEDLLFKSSIIDSTR